MGAKCCSERKNDGKEGGGGGAAPSANGGPKEPRKSVSAFANKRAKSIGYHSKGEDGEKFDKAVQANDLKGLVALLSSQQPIDSIDERMHPWAEDPKTMGALAGTQIAIIASSAEKDNPKLKDDLREAGAIPPLVDFMKSGSSDRVQTAVVALSFLTAENSPNAAATFSAGAMPLLISHLESNVGGMRAAAATTLRNICMEGEDYRKALVDQGGIKGLVSQLAAPPDPALNQFDVQLEAVLNLQDVIEDEDGGIIDAYAKVAIQSGAVEKLKLLQNSEDPEVQESVKELLASLDRVRA